LVLYKLCGGISRNEDCSYQSRNRSISVPKSLDILDRRAEMCSLHKFGSFSSDAMGRTQPYIMARRRQTRQRYSKKTTSIRNNTTSLVTLGTGCAVYGQWKRLYIGECGGCVKSEKLCCRYVIEARLGKRHKLYEHVLTTQGSLQVERCGYQLSFY
jgi:hypothetical protein